MKYTFFTTLIVIIFHQFLIAQSIAINTDSPDPSAILEIKSYSQGVLVPRMTSSDRINIESPASGLLVYDVSTKSLWFFNGGVWKEFGDAEAAGDTDWFETPSAVYTLKNVGAGISNPARKLDVGGSGNQYARVTSTNGLQSGLELVRNGVGVDWAMYNSNTYLDLLSSNDQFSNSVIRATFTTTGRFGIGTDNPQEAIHAVGNIRASGLSGSGTRRLRADANGTIVALPNTTKFWHVSGNAFHSNSPSFNYGSTAYCSSGSSGLSAPVLLPDGAIITELQAYIADYSNSEDLQLILYKEDAGTHFIESTMAQITTSGYNASLVNDFDSTIGDPIVNNQNHFYVLIVIPANGGSWDGSNLAIRNVRITYTLP